MTANQALAYRELRRYRKSLSRQQLLTLKGQIFAGEVMAAMKGLRKILEKGALLWKE